MLAAVASAKAAEDSNITSPRYSGGLSPTGLRHGKGRMEWPTDDRGDSLASCPSFQPFNTRATLELPSGDVMVGTWKDGLLSGAATFTSSRTGQVMVSDYVNGEAVGVGVSCHPDGETAYAMKDGFVGKQVPIDQARTIARNLGAELPVSPSEPAGTKDMPPQSAFGRSNADSTSSPASTRASTKKVAGAMKAVKKLHIYA